MQLLIAIEFALMLGFVLKASIHDIEQELARKPFRESDADLRDDMESERGGV